MIRRATLLLAVGTVLTLGLACGDRECPPVANECPSGCAVLTGEGVDLHRQCRIRTGVIGCREAPEGYVQGPQTLARDLTCAERVFDGAVFVGPFTEDELPGLGEYWRGCRDDQADALASVPANDLCP